MIRSDTSDEYSYEGPCQTFYYGMRYSGVRHTCERTSLDKFRACIEGGCHTGSSLIVTQTWYGHPVQLRRRYTAHPVYDGPKSWHEWGSYDVGIDSDIVYKYKFDVTNGHKSGFFHNLWGCL